MRTRVRKCRICCIFESLRWYTLRQTPLIEQAKLRRHVKEDVLLHHEKKPMSFSKRSTVVLQAKRSHSGCTHGNVHSANVKFTNLGSISPNQPSLYTYMPTVQTSMVEQVLSRRLSSTPHPEGSKRDTSIYGRKLSIQKLMDNNILWAREMTKKMPGFFKELSQQQAPEYLWIGCSDSRVPSNEIIRLRPGEVFTHRNIANVVNHTDFSCLSVVQYAVEVLKVTLFSKQSVN